MPRVCRHPSPHFLITRTWVQGLRGLQRRPYLKICIICGIFTINNLVFMIKFWNIIFNNEKRINFQLLHLLYIYFLSVLETVIERDAWVFCEFPRCILTVLSQKLCWKWPEKKLWLGGEERNKRLLPSPRYKFSEHDKKSLTLFLKWRMEKEARVVL